MSYSAKRFKSFICAVLAFVLVFGGVVVLPAQEVSAVTKLTYQSKVRTGVGVEFMGSFTVNFVKKGDKIKNLKSSSKNLVVRPTYTHSGYVDGSNFYASYSLFAKKKGTYKVTFDVYNAANKKIASKKKITVYAEGTGNVIQSVKLDGKEIKQNYSNNAYTTKKDGKVKFTYGKGIDVLSIKVEKYDKKSTYVPKSFVNGRKVTFGTYAYGSTSKYTSYYSGSSTTTSKNMYAPTRFVINYYDKYSKQEDTMYYTINRRATKWGKADQN